MTHTYANLEVSPASYVEIRDKLLAAGYDHAINDRGEVDMHGIALIAAAAEPVKPSEPIAKIIELANQPEGSGAIFSLLPAEEVDSAPNTEPRAFEIWDPSGGHKWKVYLNGRIEGFPEGCVVFNGIVAEHHFELGSLIAKSDPLEIDRQDLDKL